MIDCSTFHTCEIDALYSEQSGARELDDEAAAAMRAHAATCPACAARLERLRDHRALVLSVAIEPVPSDFEARIMAAVDAGLAKRAALAVIPAAATPAAPVAPAATTGGATILRFMSRPSFAVAATFVLVLGGAAFMMTRAGKSLAPMAMDESAPAAQAAPGASAATATAENAPLATATAAAAAADPAPVVAAAPPAATVAMGPAAGSPLPAMAGKAARPSASPADDRALAAAKALATSGRCPEALPKLDALSAQNPEADLYAARCIAKTSGCAAAAPRFDRAAQTNAGTELGSRAQLEGAKCYQSTGDVVAARKRLEAAKDEGVLRSEAEQSLEALDKSAVSKAGTVGGGSHASPKAVAAPPPAPAAAPAAPSRR